MVIVAVIVALLVGVGAGYAGGRMNPTVTRGTQTVSATTTETTTVTPQVCVSNIDNPPQDISSQYVGLMRQIIKNPAFVDYSEGRCWMWYDTQVTNGTVYPVVSFDLLHYTNEVVYACSIYPPYSSDDWITVTPAITNNTITNLIINLHYPPTLPPPPCRPAPYTFLPLSFDLLSWNSTGQEVSLTLLSGLNTSTTSLTTIIHNSTWQYTIDFTRVNPEHPLAPSDNVTQVVFLPGSPLRGNLTYYVTASGTYADGSRYSSEFVMVLRV